MARCRIFLHHMPSPLGRGIYGSYLGRTTFAMATATTLQDEERPGEEDARLQQQRFDLAVSCIRDATMTRRLGTGKPSDQVQLQFYALYKQATTGDSTQPRPSFWSPVARAKWDAHHEKHGFTVTQAHRAYADLFVQQTRNAAETRDAANALSEAQRGAIKRCLDQFTALEEQKQRQHKLLDEPHHDYHDGDKSNHHDDEGAVGAAVKASDSSNSRSSSSEGSTIPGDAQSASQLDEGDDSSSAAFKDWTRVQKQNRENQRKMESLHKKLKVVMDKAKYLPGTPPARAAVADATTPMQHRTHDHQHASTHALQVELRSVLGLLRQKAEQREEDLARAEQRWTDKLNEVERLVQKLHANDTDGRGMVASVATAAVDRVASLLGVQPSTVHTMGALAGGVALAMWWHRRNAITKRR